MIKLINYLPLNIKINLARYYLMPHRAKTAFYYYKSLMQIPIWIWQSREVANFTYDLTKENKLYLAHLIEVVTGVSSTEILMFFKELESNKNLQNKIIQKVKTSNYRYQADENAL